MHQIHADQVALGLAKGVRLVLALVDREAAICSMRALELSLITTTVDHQFEVTLPLNNPDFYRFRITCYQPDYANIFLLRLGNDTGRWIELRLDPKSIPQVILQFPDSEGSLRDSLKIGLKMDPYKIINLSGILVAGHFAKPLTDVLHLHV